MQVQLDWIVAVLNGGGQLTDAEIEERFSPAFLAEIPPDLIAATNTQLLEVAEAPYIIESVEDLGDGVSVDAVLLASDGRRLEVSIDVAAEAPNRIELLSIGFTELEFPAPIDVESIGAKLAALGPRSSLGVYDVTNGECTAMHEIRTESTIVLASVFKLWVLAALADEINDGRASWGETMAVTDELRSTPNGEMYQLETGAEVTLQQLAEAMISISDNTATDMLLHRLGRQTVEETLERAGVADPSMNVPMLSTGNSFWLRYVAEAPNAPDYRVLDEAGRRSMLDDLDQAVLPWVVSDVTMQDALGTTNVDGAPTNEPRDLDIEWFATAEDLCNTLVHLGELADSPGLEPVASILGISEGGGLPFGRDRWPTIRFKGGSEAGVVAGAWWFEGSDGDRYVVAGGVANPDVAVNYLDALLLLASAIELVD